MAAAAQENPWTEERQKAVVRVEVPVPSKDKPSVGTGFIVEGRSDDYYVITSTHTVLPDHDPDASPPAECLPLNKQTRLFRVNRGGLELLGNCVRHLGNDISLILLEPGDGKFPTLRLSRREPKNRDWLFIAGYPEGGRLDANRSAQVTRWDSANKTVITAMLTTGGMSGGPYLDAGGSVVGVHRGGLRFEAGHARMTPIWTMKNELERYLPEIQEDYREEEPQEVRHRIQVTVFAKPNFGGREGIQLGLLLDKRIFKIETLDSSSDRSCKLSNALFINRSAVPPVRVQEVLNALKTIGFYPQTIQIERSFRYGGQHQIQIGNMDIEPDDGPLDPTEIDRLIAIPSERFWNALYRQEGVDILDRKVVQYAGVPAPGTCLPPPPNDPR
ncbi:S1 family peptidase [Mesorhizobium prunaredense]|nr:serine protease [Mesorhizobium prunaredense]